MKRILMSLVTAGLFLLPIAAGATTNTATPKYLTNADGTKAVYIYLPAMTSGDTTTCVFNSMDLLDWASNSGTATTNIAWGYNPADGDSINVGLQGCTVSGGTFVNIYALAAATSTATVSAPLVMKAGVSAATLLPFPQLKIQIRAKDTFAAGSLFWILFPQIDE